jgi:hypothetical protein
MASYDEILGQLPLQQLASQWGVDESEVEQAAQTALPALLGGMQANAQDPAGAQSLASALADHQGATVNSLADVDEQDGQRIVGNIFGDNTDQVMSQLGGVGAAGGGSGSGGSLVQKLLPILAPIVMSWLANKIGQGGLGSILGGAAGGSQPSASAPDSGPLFPGGEGASSGPVQVPGGSAPASSGSNPLEDILGQVLGGASGGGGAGGAGGGAGDVLGGILGGLLGGGRR